MGPRQDKAHSESEKKGGKKKKKKKRERSLTQQKRVRLVQNKIISKKKKVTSRSRFWGEKRFPLLGGMVITKSEFEQDGKCLGFILPPPPLSLPEREKIK